MARFYIGQKVVALDSGNAFFMSEPVVEGKVYTVEEVQPPCKCSEPCVVIHITVVKRSSVHVIHCPGCGMLIEPGTKVPFEEEGFAPLEEIKQAEYMVEELLVETEILEPLTV